MMKSAYHALIGYIQIKDGFNFCFWVGQKMPWIQDPYPLEYLEQAWWIVDIIFLKTAKSYGNNNYKRSWNSREVDLFKLSWQPPAFSFILSWTWVLMHIEGSLWEKVHQGFWWLHRNDMIGMKLQEPQTQSHFSRGICFYVWGYLWDAGIWEPIALKRQT